MPERIVTTPEWNRISDADWQKAMCFIATARCIHIDQADEDRRREKSPQWAQFAEMMAGLKYQSRH